MEAGDKSRSKMRLIRLAIDLLLVSSSDSSGSAGGDETDFGTSGDSSSDGRRASKMLMVTTSVGMGSGNHGHSSDDGPHLFLGSEHMVHAAGLEDGLLGSSTSSDDADGGAGVRVDGLSHTRRKSDSGSGSVFRLRNDGGEGTGGTGVLSLITSVLLHVADKSTFGDLLDGKNISDGKRGLGSAVDVLAGVETFGSNVKFSVGSEGVGISELDLGDGGSTAGVVNDFPDNPSNETISFRVIQTAETNFAFTVECSCFEQRLGVSFLLTSDSPSHRFIIFILRVNLFCYPFNPFFDS